MNAQTALDWKGVGAVTSFNAGVTRVGGVVRVPYRRTDGSTHATHVEAVNGRRWWDPAGRELIPFGLELLPAPAVAARSILIVAEGASDCLCVRDHIAELGSMPVVVLALPGSSSWKSSWAAWADPFAEVYVAGDGDRAGDQMVDCLRRDVPQARPIRLPRGEDARSFITNEGIDAFVDLLEDARRIAEMFDRLMAAPTLVDWNRLSSTPSVIDGRAA